MELKDFELENVNGGSLDTDKYLIMLVEVMSKCGNPSKYQALDDALRALDYQTILTETQRLYSEGDELIISIVETM